MLTRLMRLARDRSGTTAVEFALVAAPFLGLIVAVFEICYVSFQAEVVAGVVETASRDMLTGRLQANSITTTKQFVDTYLCPASKKRSASLDCSSFVVDVRPATTLSSANTTNDLYKSSTNKFCPGTPGQIIVMRVAYPLPSIFPLNIFAPGGGVVADVPGKTGYYHILLGTAAFAEENYSGTFTPQAGC